MRARSALPGHRPWRLVTPRIANSLADQQGGLASFRMRPSNWRSRRPAGQLGQHRGQLKTTSLASSFMSFGPARRERWLLPTPTGLRHDRPPPPSITPSCPGRGSSRRPARCFCRLELLQRGLAGSLAALIRRVSWRASRRAAHPHTRTWRNWRARGVTGACLGHRAAGCPGCRKAQRF